MSDADQKMQGDPSGVAEAAETASKDVSAEVMQIRLDPDLRIGKLDPLYLKLSEALESSGAVELDMQAVDAVDTAGLQILLAFIREAKRQGKMVSWKTLQQPVAEAADILGMLGKLGLGEQAVEVAKSCPST